MVQISLVSLWKGNFQLSKSNTPHHKIIGLCWLNSRSLIILNWKELRRDITFNEYDYSSISHYPDILGEDNPKVVIVNKTSCGEDGCQFGQRISLSPLDIADIEKVYKCGK